MEEGDRYGLFTEYGSQYVLAEPGEEGTSYLTWYDDKGNLLWTDRPWQIGPPPAALVRCVSCETLQPVGYDCRKCGLPIESEK